MAVVTVNFGGLPGFMDKVNRAVNVGLTAAAAKHADIVRRSFTRGGRHGPGAPPGSPPGIRRGTLRNGVTHEPSVNFRAVSGVRKGIPYAKILETGGWIRAKGKKLPVPLNEQASRLGERAGSAGLRSIPNLIVLARRGRVPLLVQTNALRRSRKRLASGARGGVAATLRGGPVWALVPRVLIRARPYLKPALDKNRDLIANTAREMARRSLGVKS